MQKKNVLSLCFLVSAIAACSQQSQPSKYTENDAGPMAAEALNNFAQNRPESLLKVAYALEKAGKITEALNVYDQASAVEKVAYQANMGRIRILTIVGEKEQALRILTHISQQNHLTIANKEELAKLYLDLQEYDSALNFFSDMSDQDISMQSGRFISLLGILHELKGDSTKARILFEQARKKQGIQNKFSKLIAFSFALDGAYETAVALLQPILNDADYMNEGRLALGYIYAASGQLDPAKELIRTVKGDDFLQSRLMMLQMMPFMTRQEKAEALLFERIRVQTVKRLLPTIKR